MMSFHDLDFLKKMYLYEKVDIVNKNIKLKT